MTDPLSLTYFRLFDLSLWAIVALCLLPAFARSFTKRYKHCDDFKTALFYTAIWIVGNYTVRLAGESSIWALMGLNALAAALAIFVLILIRQGLKRDERDS